ncbi:MAG TPA: mechanosensitive ion channel family protein, partial [Candidatus Nanoarchaeia archaeon]|nr:mechanosensitive ion channel family protein [Candidatus Nanoarchaeia archaeon]
LDEQFLPLIHWTMKAIILIITAIVILKEWQLDITPLLAGLGIAGLVIGLALKPTLENVLGGISMVFDKNLKVGDVIQLDSGEIGTVNDIGFRSTKLITPDGEYIIMPNGMLAQLKMKNLTLPVPSVRIIVDFGVEYGNDINKVKKIVGSRVNSTEGILKEPQPEVLLTEMGESSLKFRVLFWIHDLKERFRMKDLITTKIYETLHKEKIGIPFPTRTIHLKK